MENFCYGLSVGLWIAYMLPMFLKCAFAYLERGKASKQGPPMPHPPFPPRGGYQPSAGVGDLPMPDPSDLPPPKVNP